MLGGTPVPDGLRLWCHANKMPRVEASAEEGAGRRLRPRLR